MIHLTDVFQDIDELLSQDELLKLCETMLLVHRFDNIVFHSCVEHIKENHSNSWLLVEDAVQSINENTAGFIQAAIGPVMALDDEEMLEFMEFIESLEDDGEGDFDEDGDMEEDTDEDYDDDFFFDHEESPVLN